MRGARVAFMACAALFLSGCNGVTHYSPAPAALQEKVDCRAGTFEPSPLVTPPPSVVDAMGSVPQGFVPVDVVKCEPGGSGIIPPGTKVVERHLSGSYGPLLAALAETSDHQDGGVCPAMGVLIPDLWLVNADGKAIHVRWPTDYCGFPKPGVEKALDALTVSSTRTLTAVAP